MTSSLFYNFTYASAGRTKIIIFIVVTGFNLKAQEYDTIDYSVPWKDQHYHDSVLKVILNDYIKTTEIGIAKIIHVHYMVYNDSTDIFRLRASRVTNQLMKLPPSYYFIHKQNIIYIYTGIEYYLNPSKQWLDSLFYLTQRIAGYKDSRTKVISWEKKLLIYDSYSVHTWDPPLHGYKVIVKDRFRGENKVKRIIKNKNAKSLIYY